MSRRLHSAGRLRYAGAGVLAATLALLACGGPGGPGGSSDRRTAGAVTADPGRAFLDRYTDPDGRVVRRDQGGDTASEGQAYALVVAEATGDRARFLAVWDWTRTHLQRPDGLLAWRWADGRVADANPAADADVDAAAALVAAARRFSLPALRADGVRLAGAVLDHETAEIGGRLVLLPGPWATADHVVNPSYFAPCTWLQLAGDTGDGRWRRMADDALDVVDDLVTGDRLPPDWARLGPDGHPAPSAAPGASGTAPRYGLDAVRLPVRLAAPCPAETGRPKELAAALWPRLQRLADGGAGLAYGLGGSPLDRGEHSAGLVGAAAAATAAGDDRAAADLLGRAADLDRRFPTYYGAAWLALDGLARAGSTHAAAGTAAGVGGPLPMRLVATHRPPGDTSSTTAPTSSPPTTGPASTTTSSPSTTSPSSTTSSSSSSTTSSSSPTTSSSSPTTSPSLTTPSTTGASSTAIAPSRQPSTTTAPGTGRPPSVTIAPGPGSSPAVSAPPEPPSGAGDPRVVAKSLRGGGATGPSNGRETAGGALSLPPPQADRLVPGGPGPVARPPAAARLHSGFLLGGLVLAAGLGVALGLSDRATARNVLGGVTGG